MRKFHNFFMLEVHPGFFVFLAVLLLLLPLKWILSWFGAALIHELFHYLVIRLNKVPVYSLQLGVSGMLMETGPMHWRAELISALAGPVGALSLVLLSSWLPEVSICAYVQSVFNLLPVYPLDGGRALRCISQKLFPVSVYSKIILWAEIVTIGSLSCIGSYLSFGMNLGLTPVLCVIMIVFRAYKAKFPCKEGKQRVQ